MVLHGNLTIRALDPACRWEGYFGNSEGNSLRIELNAIGSYDRSPFYNNTEVIGVNYSSLHDVAKKVNVKFKIPRKRLR